MSTPPRAKATAIISGKTAEAAANHTIRWSSVFVLILSFAGTIAAFNGGWPQFPRVWEGLSLLAILMGISLQIFCTILEWGYRNHRSDPRWFVPFILDTGGTYVGYAPILAPILAKALERAGLPAPVPIVLGHIAVILLALLAAYYPEQTLVDE